MKNWIYIVVFIICCQKLSAQNNCDNFIEEATDLYNSGNYDECITMLENRLKTCPLSKSKKEKAYVLLINSNIEKDSLPGIDKNFRLLLQNNPAFKIKEYNGLDDFTKKFSNYYVYPKISIGIRPHYSRPDVIAGASYQVMPDIKNQSEFKTQNFINTNIIIEYRLIEKISFFVDAGYFKINYNRTLENDFWKTTSDEELSFFQLDFGNKCFLLKSQKKINFYLIGGLSNQFLNKARLELDQTKQVVHSDPESLFEGKDVEEQINRKFESKSIRNPYVASVFFGTGAVYRIGYIGIGLDYRSYISTNTLNNKAERFSIPNLIKDFGYIDSDIRLLKTDFSFILTYSLYKIKSKKLKEN